jgi:hypothetical protein
MRTPDFIAVLQLYRTLQGCCDASRNVRGRLLTDNIKYIHNWPQHPECIEVRKVRAVRMASAMIVSVGFA